VDDRKFYIFAIWFVQNAVIFNISHDAL